MVSCAATAVLQLLCNSLCAMLQRLPITKFSAAPEALASTHYLMFFAGRRGALITIEGLDRAGKSTLGHKLVSQARLGPCIQISIQILQSAAYILMMPNTMILQVPDSEMWRCPDRRTPSGHRISSYLVGAPTCPGWPCKTLIRGNKSPLKTYRHGFLKRQLCFLCPYVCRHSS